MSTFCVFKAVGRRFAVGLVVVLGFFVAGCDEPDGSGGSAEGDSVGDGGTPPGDPVASCFIEEYGFCNDYWADTPDELEMFCISPGEWSLTESCDPAGACGTCVTDAGDFVAKTYYFDGSGSEETSQTVCENGMGVWVDVPEVTCS